ncbi:TPA: D-lactate dehydrogenase VanH-A, partial [Enterococcus faecium]|nr:D-lactate dehydrogenase VanH-A [Enterococcus faecium]
MNNIGITVYGCEQDEADAFHALSPRFGVMATIINANVSESNAKSAPFNQCISVGH